MFIGRFFVEILKLGLSITFWMAVIRYSKTLLTDMIQITVEKLQQFFDWLSEGINEWLCGKRHRRSKRKEQRQQRLLEERIEKIVNERVNTILGEQSEPEQKSD